MNDKLILISIIGGIILIGASYYGRVNKVGIFNNGTEKVIEPVIEFPTIKPKKQPVLFQVPTEQPPKDNQQFTNTNFKKSKTTITGALKTIANGFITAGAYLKPKNKKIWHDEL